MHTSPRWLRLLAAGTAALAFNAAAPAEKLHFTYLWHLEQPIYWPDQQVGSPDRYETAWKSIQHRDAGAAHPTNNLRDIFGLADRVAAYQDRPKNSIDAIRWAPEAGAQITFSGGLIENIQSLGDAGQLGYSSTWYNHFRTARNWLTTGHSKPRCDVVLFPFHHPLLPLIDDSTVRKEIQLYKAAYAGTWGASPAMSRGLFPPEMAFSTRLIQALKEEGVDWVVVSGEHVSRACTNFPVILGTGGINCSPPNRADQLNAPQTNWYRKHIDRGCSPTEAVPFGFTPHRMRHVDPDTGSVYEVIAVPAAQAVSWDNGYGSMDLTAFNTLQANNDANRPMLVMMAHDGDNAWGGGYSYYLEATPNLVSMGQAAGYVATVVEEYLAGHPVPADDIIHVEDGAWVNADGDFGAPEFLNWNWPLVNASGQIDIPGGWAEDERNWAVITAAQNRVNTAEQIAGGVNIAKILSPDGTTTEAERAWHYFLGSLNSGYMYYGTAEDMEVKPTVACNEAVEHANAVIGGGAADATPPTIWIPQRHPWNPGSLNFGPQFHYAPVNSPTDFWVWTFAYDVSGIAGVTLKYRIDADGQNPLASTQNETYAGGAEVGAWQSLAMTQRAFPAGNFFNSGSIDFFEMPQYIADEYYAHVTGLASVLIDYYVEATDSKGFTRRSPIQHVYIGDGAGSSGGGGDVVAVTPTPVQAGSPATITYDPAGRPLAGAAQVKLHYGFNNWSPVVSPDPAMTWNAADSVWEITVPIQQTAAQLDLVFNNGGSTWDNNGGADWHFPVQGASQPPVQWTMDGVRDTAASLVASNNGIDLYAGVIGNTLYVAAPDAGEGNDHFILVARNPGSLRAAMWAKAGQIANWDAFLADENNNDYEGWFDAAGTNQAMTGPNGGVLEGTLDLVGELGTLPAQVYVAFAAYPTADGAALVSGSQCPASVNANGNVDAAEYVAVNICAVRVDLDDADVNRDCTVDLSDLAALASCLNGPELLPSGSCTAGGRADLDDDGDVDLEDYAEFQRIYP